VSKVSNCIGRHAVGAPPCVDPRQKAAKPTPRHSWMPVVIHEDAQRRAITAWREVEPETVLADYEELGAERLPGLSVGRMPLRDHLGVPIALLSSLYELFLTHSSSHHPAAAHALHHHVMLIHHLPHELAHELQVLVHPLAHLLGRHAGARLCFLHLRRHVLHHLHVLLQQLLALGTRSGLRGSEFLLCLLCALDELLLRLIRRGERAGTHERVAGSASGSSPSSAAVLPGMPERHSALQ
jgi:hypothetical protein